VRTALFWLIALLSVGPAAAQSPLSRMMAVSELPRFRPVTVGMFSSYDRTGKNDDGFSGTHSFLRKEGDGLVIAELQGAGALTRIWTPTPIDAPIEFYIDGKTSPSIRLPFSALFRGQTAPFTGPLVGSGTGGYWSYVPIEFQRSIKVVVRAPRLKFYQINYALYPKGTRVQSATTAQLDARTDGKWQGKQVQLAAGSTAVLFDRTGGGRIEELRLNPAEALAADSRDIFVRMNWDGSSRPAVELPVTELFGHSFGRPAARSLLFGTEDGENYVRFPMPFSRSARIELVSRRTGGPPILLNARVKVSERARTPDEGYFHAHWRRERETRKGVPFKMLSVQGKGHLAGFTLQVQGAQPGDTGFFEGDDVVQIDGKLALHGTGTEDAFNGGWYGLPGRWNERGSFALSGALDYSRQLARTGGYRLLMSDAYSFTRSIDFSIEHGPEDNAADGDYAGGVFFYLDRPEGSAPPERDTAVLKATSFRVGTNPMMGLDSLIYASLKPEGKDLPSGWVPVARFERIFKDGKIVFDDEWGPPLLSLRVEAPQAGRYAVMIDALTGPGAAKLQLRDANFAPIGTPTDFYAPAEDRSGYKKIGEVVLNEGLNLLHITMPERNPASTGQEVAIIDVEGRLIGAIE
jgi:hypothetical protein